MEDYSIIPGQTLLEIAFALLLIIVTAYVYVWCRNYAQRRNPGYVARLTTIGHPGTRTDREPCSGGAGFSPLNQPKSWTRNWLAPLIVWAAVIWTALAVIGILLGDN